MAAANVCYYMGLPVQSDSIFMVAAKKYPRGEAAMTVAFSTILRKDVKAQDLVTAYQQTAKRFPENELSSDLHNRTRAHIASAYLKEKDTIALNNWLSVIKDTLTLSNTEIQSAEWLLEQGDTLTARAMMDKGIKRMLTVTANRGMYKGYEISVLMNYAEFLFKLKSYPQSLKIIKEVYDSSAERSVKLQQLYATILVANKRGGDALDILATLLKDGQGDDMMKASLKEAYTQAKGTQDGYNEYVQRIDSVMKAKLVKDTQLEMLNEKAPLFTLQGLEGDTVSLDKLKGKIVILDFWATWCGPCKRSFPAMKKAINRYVQDQDVVFLFIDCMEKTKNVHEQISKFLSDHEYPFHVLMGTDTNIPDRYGVKGIPNKIIIDRNGTIRYRVIGFDEGDDAAVERLSLMIEAAKKAV
ncbi:TlpA family protein disulfide reductase [Chitinophaga sancti]|uniref:Thiol-disulfide isomerase or thioredoxin n=1 Tax=Chitinophaga sancti TaxID=1004 RepID=A0A1K1QZ06_9BACT|nr:TlpA disulfide reductase family protein [Chitinophaga sancti]WQD62115.1 TlpA disulfide reductase family protein [Chitinophaga sancti]WQG92316.1 TlpA disulfide reductase family protein [Chitinophaga sancti]SFW65151.1 Thiol-disulfide isomerase or thioredoxin [Chitinophaga sancti]